MLFKEGYGVLDNTKSLHEMFIFADECLATMSKLIQSSESSSQIVDLGALFLSIQLHQLEGQPAEATVEESVLENLVNSCWTLLKAAWGKNANAVSVIHRAISTFAFKCAAMTFVPSVLKLSLDLMEALTPLSVGLDNVLSNSWDLSAALNLVTTLVTGVQKSGKRSSIRKVFQRIVVSLSRIIEGSGNVDLVVQSITLLTRFSEDRILELSRSDLSLILNACSLLAAKHSPLFKAAGQTSESTFLGPDDLFDAVCRLLTSILTQRREPLVDSIPAYVGVIRGLLHCFKQDLGGLQASSESSGNNIPTFIQTPYPYFSKLKLNNPIAAAESLARILEKMTQKSAIGSGASKETRQRRQSCSLMQARQFVHFPNMPGFWFLSLSRFRQACRRSLEVSRRRC
ncbi:hypothetical protein BCR33DRAFT_305856 [Rhizoclosmatium globosum]|uniref:Nucleolar 27S pre-rRNA processing Urb2/Npa2 C-terminal domain-containing protein n=1 Tax=Rhizoclosmatium globosum TaxID=329046 RepID=A0A1Y2C5K3_9FUNG|nr:hypothetical protein BCR33DRAFT_305856 [Rhizoclosmatium globosum]|eukprot:ORY42216.1 hypothetical protein BCR33DRAFT_305856 [Rhizoclosmatium globosum]